MAAVFLEEILEQSSALHDVIRCYQAGEHRDRLRSIPRPGRVLLSGMGASFHAAQYGALLFGSHGIAATAVEASELLNFGASLLDSSDMLLLISQSGSSGEILSLLERLPRSVVLVVITNHSDSPLAYAAQHTLLQCAGSETTVATKTYLNTLACLWMLGQHWAALDVFTELTHVADAVQRLLDDRTSLVQSWVDTIGDCQTLVFLGHGPHIPTARQGAMMLAEWAKLPALSSGIGAFRHGFIEIVSPHTGIITFGAGGTTADSVLGLINEVTGYGARTLSIVNGHSSGQAGDTSPQSDDFLAPLLDVIPAQLFAAYMAHHLHVPPGFRYIQKVVRQL